MRLVFASLLVAGLLGTAVPASASSTPSAVPSLSASPGLMPRSDAAAHTGSTLDGRVSSVDFPHGTLEIETPAHAHVTVAVPPSTTVQGKDAGYHSVTDLVRGTSVQILTSDRGGRLTAQIIRIK